MDKLNKHKPLSGKDFAINLLIAFPFATVIVTILRMLGWKVGIPMTGSIILFGLAYLIGIMKKEIKAKIEIEKFKTSTKIAKKWTTYAIIFAILFSIYVVGTGNALEFGLIAFLLELIIALLIYSFLFGGATFVVVLFISILMRKNN